jgi:uncharacterized protein YceH (UPF0502 family)
LRGIDNRGVGIMIDDEITGTDSDGGDAAGRGHEADAPASGADPAAQSGAPAAPQSELDMFEIRVLAVLAEKEALTPDAYPMSLNALTNGCNQLSSRDPVMSIGEDTVQEILTRLIARKLVSEVTQAGARVRKYEHRLRIKWTLERDRLAILTLLMLRGPQTVGEIRARSGRMFEFATLGDVETGLQYLIDKYPPMVARLPRAPGAKEGRYAHLLSGEEVVASQETAAGFGTGAGHGQVAARLDRTGALEAEVARLRLQVEELSLEFERFRKQFD